MADIFILAHMDIKPDYRDELLDIMKEAVPASRAEAGNKRYELTQDLKDAGRFSVIEIWNSQEAIDRHNASPHFQRLAAFFEKDPGRLEINQLRQLL